MTADYSTALATDKDKIRLMIGDTASPWKLQNEEISYFAALHTPNLNVAAAACADAIAAVYASRADSIGNMSLSISYGDLARKYRELADRLRAQPTLDGNLTVTTVKIGGILVSERERLASDDSQFQPSFTPGLHDNVNAKSSYDPLKADIDEG